MYFKCICVTDCQVNARKKNRGSLTLQENVKQTQLVQELTVLIFAEIAYHLSRGVKTFSIVLCRNG